MKFKYLPIVKAKKGEFEAYENLPEHIHKKILPLFELPKFKPAARFEDLVNPLEAYLDELIDYISSVRNDHPVMFDFSLWAPNSCIEDGEHVIGHMYNNLLDKGTPVYPVIGYDRWDDPEYSSALREIDVPGKVPFCLRLGSDAFDDFYEPEYFHERIEEIFDSLSISPNNCIVILDFGDTTNTSVIEIQEIVELAFNILNSWELKFISIAGCSLSPNIVDSVKDKNSSGKVLRREMMAWKALKKDNPSLPLIFGDYGVRNPKAVDDVIAPDANGKIRYTINQHFYIERGHSKRQGDKGAQTYKLSQSLMGSGYYMGPEFSWGDARIKECSEEKFKGNASNWIAIDTNHHTHAVVSEVLEFERTLVVSNKAFAS